VAWFGEVARNIESVLAPDGSHFLNGSDQRCHRVAKDNGSVGCVMAFVLIIDGGYAWAVRPPVTCT
jgi:hypothetical protein